MQITSVSRHIHVDIHALRVFLVELGVSVDEIEQLRIRFQWGPNREQAQSFVKDGHTPLRVRGCYMEPSRHVSVFLLATLLSPQKMNRTLLHELDHYRHHGYGPDESAIAYWSRPSEIAARAFAATHHNDHQFVTVDQEKMMIVLALLAFIAAIAAGELVLLELFFAKNGTWRSKQKWRALFALLIVCLLQGKFSGWKDESDGVE